MIQRIKRFFRDPKNIYLLRWLRHPLKWDYRKRWRMTLREWLLYHQRYVEFEQCRWMGKLTYKNPMDAWIYQEIIWEVRPDVLVEIGSKFGGSTLFFANLMDVIGHGEIISVDIDRSFFGVEHPRIALVTGDSGSSAVIEEVCRICSGKSVLVVHDGDHDKEPVMKDLRSYSPLVSINSYFIVEDGIIDLFRPFDGFGRFNDGPLAATEEFVRTNPNFVVDKSRERYLLTYNPRGFLKRVR